MRETFSKRKIALNLPNLADIQLNSYNWLMNEGLKEILEELGTVEDSSGRGWVVTLSDPSIEKENISIPEAKRTGRTFDAPWYVKATIEDPLTKKKKVSNIYMGDLPLMTQRGTFVISGVERTIVNQLIRAEGVLFTGEPSPVTGQFLAGAKILPKSGVWLEFETSRNGVLSVRIDRKRKIAVTTLLRVFGLEEDEDIRKTFENVESNPEINYINETLAKDPASSFEESCIEIYRKMRPGEPLVLENAKALVAAMFFNKRRFSMGHVGRFKLNKSLGLNIPNDADHRLLTLEDLIKIVSRIIELNNGVGVPDDVDFLGNRRVKSVGELLQWQMRIGFLRMEKNIKERMSLSPRETLPEPSVLISPRAIAAAVHSFFATGQLSQLHDQQNPLTALDHLRRLSVLGPGGLTKERASFSVRDVHYSSFGRVCPVRTPEGPNIGLINYLASYAKVNEYGFLETPYIKLEKKPSGDIRLTDEIVYLAAYDEENAHITDQSVAVDAKGFITDKQVPLRKGGNFFLGDVALAEYIEVVPRQVVGVAAGLIPFLQNNDIARALMGTQQMSQAVPLIRPETPIIGTGIEGEIARNTNALILADGDGVVEFADARKVIVKYGHGGKGSKVEYTAAKFEQTNSDTCFNQYVVVETGQKVKEGDVLVEGPAVNNGELSIGTNMKVAYMIYEGLEFEDGIVISDRLVKEDVLTSIHVSDYQTSVQETKLGPEEITRDIPNVSEESLRNLDEDGIVAVGSKVKSSDILVGKVAPKGEMDLTSEERLLRAIFGEKAKDVRDTSLYMPHGEHGVVIGIKRVTKKDNESLPAGTIERITVYVAQQKKIDIGDKLAGRHGNKGVISAIVPVVDMPMLPDGTTIDIIFSSEAVLKRMNVGQILEASLGMAGKTLGKTYEVPSLQEIPEELINAELMKAGLPVTGKMKLIDGRNGEYFHNEIVVGDTYILKLIHMSEEKMHARSTGPYSLITQQPLGGKAQFGGQRFGEMEVWALEAYGAANILKEILTIKSDDMLGRTQAYSAMVQGKEIPESSVPETFKLLVRKLNGLGLGLEAYSSEEGSGPAEEVEESVPEAEVVDTSTETAAKIASEEISEQEAESEE
ncbi:DNA-directed RNA polymerase subunit beta [candidate division WWE3 bacterium RIFOXYC2_FULL_42_13]|uniref:DNA-directed RNA polymerase subunit beta n=4 Tax=Katanobacteria TaxID=422282 RepID=A0A3D0ZQY4_UNCKA|nr:MAG: DNA-directed RNA polymerase subunit beta [candidate division WWE3 bacterium RIFOXYA2_FULL_43_12]OGC65581.1 MAG: DNA-directed RNA polymerase subunit beta [candidate division WWE3 bacterium RIFOXYA12_FULL_43_11]OGC71983.1 MAG: DNA-directed RNA polymerase subunit beta [candidate division WWE3 bacterium RIFOXYB2_FULL_43_9]OGC73387.1 MAG: DNA-directed RNA polymerase subunit beta [candidate division WWE3 bacterium RIFOXYC2_FULL_42_13]OGC75668.1 MAG: DNA-directed RNA polymerase subunit beta [c